MHTILGIICILVGCYLNNIILEIVITHDKGCGLLMTFTQFAFVCLTSFKDNVDWSKKRMKNTTPMKHYFVMTVFYFAQASLNSYAFSFGISQPFNLVFRSSLLLVTLVIGFLVFGERYNFIQIFSIVVITIGIIITTIVETAQNYNGCADCGSGFMAIVSNIEFSDGGDDYVYGLMFIVASICLLSSLGHYQRRVYGKYNTNVTEGMFYTHVLALPMFLLTYRDIYEHVLIFNSMPFMWGLLVLNIITQYICLVGVFCVNKALGSVTCNFVTTIRKFLSLLTSVFYFNNPFTYYHWVGSSLVFTGAILYSISTSKAAEKKKEE